MRDFKEEFIWGTACASYQCEGAWDEDGKGPNIWDDFSHVEGNVKNNDTGDRACDSYHRYKEDVAIMKKMGIKVYRFSISWARVFPTGRGEINEKGLEFYDNLVNELIANGIEPWITLYHWDLPSALQAEGGWLARSTVDAFEAYAELIGRHFSGRVHVYMPINEPQCVNFVGHGIGEHAPGYQLPREDIVKIYHHLALGHCLADRALRRASKDPLKIGTVTCGRMCYTDAVGDAAEEAAYRASFDLSGPTLRDWAFTHNIYLDSIFFQKYDESAPDFVKEFEKTIPQSDWDIMVKPDFVGLNIYNGGLVDENGNPMKHPSGYPHTGIDWPITPKIMYFATRHLYKRYGLPIIITEDGVSCDDKIYLDGKVHDLDRIDFLSRYLMELKRSIESGVPVIGYLHWSFLDNFEWACGYAERFGLVYVDYETCERTPKDSARWYSKLITSGNIPGLFEI